MNPTKRAAYIKLACNTCRVYTPMLTDMSLACNTCVTCMLTLSNHIRSSTHLCWQYFPVVADSAIISCKSMQIICKEDKVHALEVGMAFSFQVHEQ